MPDTTAPEHEHHPFDPEAIKRVAAFVAAIPASVITIAIRPGGTLRRPDLAQLLERDEWSDTTRLELAEACAKLRSQRDELHAENERHRAAHQSACKLVADMHAAAVGEVRGPNRGVVEDIADLRARCLAAEEALQIALKRKDG